MVGRNSKKVTLALDLLHLGYLRRTEILRDNLRHKYSAWIHVSSYWHFFFHTALIPNIQKYPQAQGTTMWKVSVMVKFQFLFGQECATGIILWFYKAVAFYYKILVRVPHLRLASESKLHVLHPKCVRTAERSQSKNSKGLYFKRRGRYTANTSNKSMTHSLNSLAGLVWPDGLRGG